MRKSLFVLFFFFFLFEIGWSWWSQSPDMNDELTNLIWDRGRTCFDRCFGRTCAGQWTFFELRERERDVLRPWHGRMGGPLGCTKSGPRVLRVGSIMNHPSTYHLIPVIKARRLVRIRSFYMTVSVFAELRILSDRNEDIWCQSISSDLLHHHRHRELPVLMNATLHNLQTLNKFNSLTIWQMVNNFSF